MKRYILIIFAVCISVINFAQNTNVQLVLSDSGGIYQSALDLTLSADSNKIFYTLDGTKPTSSSKKYTKPIRIEKTTAVRAVVYLNGKPGKVITQTYFIGRTFDMAVISIVGNPDDLFGFTRGIYVKGCCADSVPPYKYANFWKGWERKMNIEFYEPTGELCFNQEAGIRIFGGFSKGLPMKSLAIIARKKYGEKRIAYPIFPNKEIKKYKSIVLRNSGSDFNNTHFRDALLTNLVEPLDIEIQAYRPSVVFINGEYWGVHNVREKINEYYLKSNVGANPDSVDIMKHRNDLLAGKRDHYLKMKKFIKKTDFSDTSAIRYLNTQMEISNFIDYNITEVYVDNRDAGGNIRFWRPQTEEGRWRWILFDTDISFGISAKTAYKKNTLDKMTNFHNEKWPDPPWSTLIIRNLLENDSIKNVYINRFADHLNTIFSTENVHRKIDSIQAMLEYEMPFHFKKWRSNNPERWQRNVQRMKDFAMYRPHYVRQHLIERFDLSDTVQIEIQNENPTMGFVQVNSIQVYGSFKGVYFKNAPALVAAIPKIGYEFEKWKEGGHKVQFLVTSDVVLKPIFKKKVLSQYKSQVVINEMSIHQDSTKNSGDWIELLNDSNTDIPLEGWKIISGNKKYVFSEGASIKANEYCVIARNSSGLEGSILEHPLGLGLSSHEDHIILLDGEGFVVDSLHYNIVIDFPELESEENKNIERLNPTLDDWQISNNETPGSRNDLFVPLATEKSTTEKSPLFLYVVVGILSFGVLLLLFFLTRRKPKV